MRIGILALQGAYAAHASSLGALGHETTYLRSAADFEGIDGLVLPGGESSVHMALIERFGLEEAITSLAREQKPVLATCAGLILMAREVTSPVQRSLRLLDIAVARNAYGRQLHSFEDEADGTDLPLLFIRAPRILHCEVGVEIMATHRGEPVLVRQGQVWGATFHPELSADLRVHRAAFGDLSRSHSASAPFGA